MPFYIAKVLVFACSSLYWSLSSGTPIPPCYIYFPDVYGEAMPNADIPLFAANLVMGIIAAVIIRACDGTAMLLVCNVPLLSTIILLDLLEIQAKLREANVGRVEIKRRLLKIIVMQMKYTSSECATRN